MTRTITVSAIQAGYGQDLAANIAKTEFFVKEAALEGAHVALPPELFQGIYFCTTQDESWFSHAYPVAKHPCVVKLQPVAKALGIALPVSIFEKDGPHYFNSLVMLDEEGEILGAYRKSHIPDGPGYSEKFYFRPGDTGYKAWKTRRGVIGAGICWDQWYPECARALTLLGAEILFYPTAIGSEPQDTSFDTKEPWRRAMQGHAVSNVIPVVAANRTGTEKGLGAPQSFYGSSFIADERGELVASLGRDEEGIITQTFDLEALAKTRASWGFFRDRRDDLGPKLASAK